MKNFLKFVFLLMFAAFTFSQMVLASESEISPQCKLKMYVSGKWMDANPLRFSGMTVSTYESNKAPNFLYFKSEGKVFSGPRTCFTEVLTGAPPEEGTQENTHQATKSMEGGQYYPWNLYIGLGATLSPKTKHTVTISTTTATEDEAGKASYIYSLEGVYRFTPLIGLSAIYESSPYKYNTAGSADDSHAGFMVMPRFTFGSDARFWLGAGLGFMISSIKGGTASGSGVTITGSDQSTAGLVLSPRLGFDFKVADKIFLGLMGSYTTFPGKITGTATDGVSTLSFTDSIKRSWLSALLRISFEF